MAAIKASSIAKTKKRRGRTLSKSPKGRAAEVLETVVTVTTKLTEAEPEKAKLEGLTVQVVVVGAPLQVRVTLSENPPLRAATRLTGAVWPAVTVCEVEEPLTAEMLKLGVTITAPVPLSEIACDGPPLELETVKLPVCAPAEVGV